METGAVVAHSGDLPAASLSRHAKRLMKTKTHFQFRLQVWDANGDDVLERVIGTDDFAVAQSLYRAALKRWPNARVILRQGAHAVHDSGSRSAIA